MRDQLLLDPFNLSAFDPVSLSEVNRLTALLRRVDTKYVVPPSMLPALLDEWSSTHSVLEIDEKRVSHYRSVYYDTAAFDLFRAHHAGAGNRVKLRVRSYTESDLSFYEEKIRTNQGITDKHRVRLMGTTLLSELLSNSQHLYPRHLQQSALRATLQVEYDRITLVSKKNDERITIDVGLMFRTEEDRSVSFNDRIIVEVKHARGVRSGAHNIFRRLGIRAGSISKYCLGILSLYPQVKQNRFKLPLRILDKQLRKHAFAASTGRTES